MDDTHVTNCYQLLKIISTKLQKMSDKMKSWIIMEDTCWSTCISNHLDCTYWRTLLLFYGSSVNTTLTRLTKKTMVKVFITVILVQMSMYSFYGIYNTPRHDKLLRELREQEIKNYHEEITRHIMLRHSRHISNASALGILNLTHSGYSLEVKTPNLNKKNVTNLCTLIPKKLGTLIILYHIFFFDIN